MATPAVRDPEVETAIKICTDKEFKKKVLKVSGIEVNKNHIYKVVWNGIVESFISEHFTEFPAKDEVRERVTGFVYSIAFRMLTWLEFHVPVFNFDLNYGLSLLIPDIFTLDGIIKYEWTRTLVGGAVLDQMDRFRLASWHCMEQASKDLFFSLDQNRYFFHSKDEDAILEPEIVRFWGFFLEDDINRIKDKKSEVRVGYPGKRIIIAEEVKTGLKPLHEEERKSVDEFMLECAISSGSKTAVEFCITKLKDRKKVSHVNVKTDVLVDVLIKVVIHKMKLKAEIMKEFELMKGEKEERIGRKLAGDWIVFRSPKFMPRNRIGDIWTPSHFLVDIFYSIFSEMSTDEKSSIGPKLKDAIELNFKVRTSHQKQLFCHFLCWPYQDKLMEFANLCWEYVPNEYYGSLLFSILNRNEPNPGSLYYGENKTYNYSELFREFWRNSSENFKRYVFRDIAETKKCVLLYDNTAISSSLGKTLLLRMIIHKSSFINTTMIKVILDSVTFEGRKNFFGSDEGSKFFELLRKRDSALFKEILGKCVESKDEFTKTKNKLEAVGKCLELIKCEKYLAVENTFKNLKLTEKDMFEVKEKVICCDEGKQLCIQLGLKDAKKLKAFFDWGKLASPPKIYPFIEGLLSAAKYHCLLATIDESEKATEFLEMCYFLKADDMIIVKDEIEKYKKNIAYNEGLLICNNLIFEYVPNRQAATSMEEILNRVDKLINWCFESRRDKDLYKRVLLNYEGGTIHYNLIKCGRVQDASTFLSWVGLSEEEIKQEKRNKFFNCRLTSRLFIGAMHVKERSTDRRPYENFVRLILEWFLVDREAIMEFCATYSYYRNDPLIENVIRDLENRLQN